MLFTFEFKHPCGVTLRAPELNILKLECIKVIYKFISTTVFIKEVPMEAVENFRMNYAGDSMEFSNVMIGIAQVIEHLEKECPYATGKIDNLKEAYNAWQKWCQEDED